MKKWAFLGFVGVLVLTLVVVLPNSSQAVPSYSRQIQKPCSACHTIWPNLNQAGRQFKVKAYTDVSPEWKMITKDGLNLLAVLPVAARVFAYPYMETSRTGEKSEDKTDIPHEAEIMIAGRAHDYVGVFTEFAYEKEFELEAVRLAFHYPVGEGNTAGAVLFKGDSASADPFNSLGGRSRRLHFGGEARAKVLDRGFTFSFLNGDNQGAVAHGYFLGNRLYTAVGAMRGGKAPFGTNKVTSDPIDTFLRAAWDQKLPFGAVTFGAAHYIGKQEIEDITEFKSNVRRTYLDTSFEASFNDHLIEAQALYGIGRDKNVGGTGVTGKFDGFYLEGSYFYMRKIGLVAAYNTIDFKNDERDKERTWIVGTTFLPWANVKLGLQYANTRSEFVTNRSITEKIFRTVIDIVF